MPEGDPLQILLSHDRWATGQLLDACDPLSAEQFHRRFEIGPGSLHNAITHIIATTRAWTDTLRGQPARPRVDADGQSRTTAQLRALLDESYDEFTAEVARRPLAEIVTRTTRDGRTFRLTRAALFAHVVTHAMHHRAQCLNMLRHLGVQPLPLSSVAEWTWAGEERR